MKRRTRFERKTKEVKVNIELNIDGTGKFDIQTGIPFFNHMLNQFAKHGYFDIKIKALGDIEVDFHHTVEDVGISLGEAFGQALGDKKGIVRYGHSIIPFDDSLVEASIDLSGRPYLVFNAKFEKNKIGEFDVELAEEFFKSFSNSLKCNLHIDLRYGSNLHHMIEAMFKAAGRALDQASGIDGRTKQVPSTKGKL
ncbi:MAG: imidazoleglycerol-phosphate dehydratase HisB [Thermodesulfobacteriota bacterium]